MKEMKNLKRVAQEELEKLDAKYANLSEFTAADAEMYKCLMMALEKQMRIEQIEMEMNPYDEEGMEGMSGRRMRNPNNGRYMSGREAMPYYEGEGYSGHYPYPPHMGGYPRY